MNGHKMVLYGNRGAAHNLVTNAPNGSIMTIEPPRRTIPQNARLHANLTAIAAAKPDGRRHTPDDWKAIFMNACGWECQFLEGLDGRPFPQGFRSSKMSKAQMSALLEYIAAFAAERGIVLKDAG